MGKSWKDKIFQFSFRSRPLIIYSSIAVGVLVLLLICFKLGEKSAPVFGAVGFYFLYIPIWLILSIAVLKLLSLTVKALRIGLVILFFLGLFLIFVADRPVEGLLALGPVGFVMVAILNFIFTTLLISLAPGILAGLFVGVLLGSRGDSGLALIVGFITLIVVTGAVFNFIWKWVIPFSIGFSISLLIGQIVGAMVSVIFSGYRLVIPNISDFVSDISNLELSRLSRSINIISNSVKSLFESIKLFWQNYPIIFIGAAIFGIVFAAILGNDDKKKSQVRETSAAT